MRAQTLHYPFTPLRHSPSLYPEEAAATLYLITPLLIFFSFFIRLELAILAIGLIAFMAYELLSGTCWRRPIAGRWQSLYFLAIAALWFLLSTGVGPLRQTADWWKQYSVLNYLIQHTWPATGAVPGLGDSALRYSLGWYLAPAALSKAMGRLHDVVLFAWSILGIYVFFKLLPGIVGRSRATVLAPLIFALFGGADIAGTLTERYEATGLPIFALEWWVGWASYSGNTTALLWAPQHAIPAWIAVALLMRSRERPALLPYLGLLFSATLLWSPLVAVGLVPFLMPLLLQHGARLIILNWRPLAAAVFVAVPLGLYLSAGTEAIPKGFIGTIPCLWNKAVCFSWSSYVLFILVELGLPFTILILQRDKEPGFVVAAGIALCLIPLYKVGIWNDFALRASLPALAVLAILCTKVLVTGPKRHVATVLLVFLLALPTSIFEIYSRTFPGPDIPVNATFDDPWGEPYREQYFAPLPIWVLRPVL